jgi:putative FmdB family regulatory protein
MPIYTYKCKKCNTTFDFLSGVGKGAETPVCPKCQSSEVEKTVARFSVKIGGGTGSSSCPTGTCPLSDND